MSKNNTISEVLEEFDDKWKMSIEASGFMKNDRRGIEFYVVKEWLKQKLQEVEAHETEDGYCCACSYDIACMNEKIDIAVQKKVEDIKKSKTKIVGILFNAQNSPIEYSLQEIADKIIKIIKN